MREILAEAVLAMADDEVILGHRDSEWAGHAPILEEDIAFANIALDELGHAGIWYRLAAELLGEDPETFPDRQVFERPAQAFRCCRLVELPQGDWAFTIVRQYLFDAAEIVRLTRLSASEEPRLRAAAEKILTEERYHERHGRAWVRRLGLGTEESRLRMAAAINLLWPYAGQLTAPPSERTAGLPREVWPGSAALTTEWEAYVRTTLGDAGLEIPAGKAPEGDGRGEHSEYLAPLLAELQSVARLAPDAAW